MSRAFRSWIAAHPAVGVGEARGVELVRAPLGLRPVEPVLHDVVERDPPRAEAVHHVEALLLRLVALAALPEAEGPARHHRRLAGEPPVAGDDAVEARAVDEVVVDAVADLGPERRRSLLRRRLPQQPHRLHPLVLRPLDLQARGAPLLERHAGDVLPGQPALAPVVDDQPAVDPHPDAAVRVELEEVVAGLGRLDRALPAHARPRPPAAATGWMRRFGCFVPPGTAMSILGSTRVATSLSKPAPA